MFEENAWNAFALEHPKFDFTKFCSELVPPQKLWSISNFYTELVGRLHVQIRLTGNFSLNSSLPLVEDQFLISACNLIFV